MEIKKYSLHQFEQLIIYYFNKYSNFIYCIYRTKKMQEAIQKWSLTNEVDDITSIKQL